MPARSGRRRRPALWGAVAVGVVLALFVAVLATRDSGATNRSVESPLLGDPAPALAGASMLDGEEFDLGAADGWVVVNFFATWCEPCRKEHPELLRFAQDHQLAGDAQVVSVVFEDEPEDVERYFRDNGGDWPVLEAQDGRVIVDWSVSGVPESYLVGPEGSVRAKIVGGVDADKLEDLLRRAQGQSSG